MLWYFLEWSIVTFLSVIFFFQLKVFESENAEIKMIFATQFVFYLMVLFVRAANIGKVTQCLVHFCTVVAPVGVM